MRRAHRRITRRAALASIPSALCAQDSAGPSGLDEAALIKHGVPGAQLWFDEQGKKSLSWSAGVAEKSSGRKVSAGTLLEAASLSKPVFACAVLRLCANGHLSLKDRLGDLLPARDLPTGDEFGRITVRQILTHTSGIPPDPPRGRMVKLLFQPGARFAYSPHAFDYLQRAAERISGKPLRALVEELVLQPLEMTQSSFQWTTIDANRAVGYDARGNAGQTINERVERMSPAQREEMKLQYPFMNFPNAASSLITTARDYARFLAGITAPAPAGLLPEEFAKQTRVTEIDAGKNIGWGLAFGTLKSSRCGIGLWQWGDFGIFQNFAVVFPESQSSLVVLTNGARGQRLNRYAAKALLGEDLACFAWLGVG